MKIRRKLAAMLAFAVLTGSMTVGASAASADDFKDMPDDWSRAALTHAVENGLLNGADGLIDPQGLLTRAQLAAIVNRAFGAETAGDISGFTDVPSSEWYYSDMQKAVHMGTFQGSNGKLNPGSAISRQEALTVLARAFRLSGGADAALAGFSDAGEVASWAKGSVAALVAAGYVSGSNGRLNPTASITRAEFAQVMDNLLPVYLPEKYEGTVDGNAMVRTAGTVLDKATIKGDLVIGDGVGNGDVTLRDTKVEGRLVVRGGGIHSIIITGSSDVGSVVVSKVDGNVRVVAQGGAQMSVVVVDDGKDDVIIEGTVDKVEVTASDVPVVLQNAKVNDVVVSGGSSTVTVDKASEVKTLTVSEAAKDTAVSVSGKVTDVKTEATGTAVTVASTGKVDTVAVADTASNSTVTADKGATVSKVETAASGTEVKGDGKVDKVEAQAGSEGTKVTTPSTDVTADKEAGAVDTGKNEVKPGETGKTEGNTPSGGGSSGGSSSPSTYTVTFVNSENAEISKVSVQSGSTVTPPTEGNGYPTVSAGQKLTWWSGNEWFDLTKGVTSNMTLQAVVGSVDFTAGDGTEAHPYLISNEDEFKRMNGVTVASHQNYRLNNDIAVTVNSTAFQTDLYAVVDSVAGSLDGNGKMLTVTCPNGATQKSWNGVFGYAEDFAVSDLTVKNTSGNNLVVVQFALGDAVSLTNVTFNNENVQECDGNSAIFIYTMQLNNSGTVTLDGCVNTASMNGTSYNAIFAGIKINEKVENTQTSANNTNKLVIKNCTNTGNLSCQNAALMLANHSNLSLLQYEFSNNFNSGRIRGTQTVDVGVARSTKTAPDATHVSGGDALNTAAQTSLSQYDSDLFVTAYMDGSLAITADTGTKAITITKGALTNIDYYVVSLGIFTNLYFEGEKYGTWFRTVTERIEASAVNSGSPYTCSLKYLGFTDDASATESTALAGNPVKIKEEVEYYYFDHSGDSYVGIPDQPAYVAKPSSVQVQAFDSDGILLATANYSGTN